MPSEEQSSLLDAPGGQISSSGSLDDLGFHDLQDDHKQQPVQGSLGQQHQPDIPIDDSFLDDDDGTSAPKTRPEPSSNPFSIGFYSRYFDVDTVDVVLRLKATVDPRKGKFFEEEITQGSPDYYGPFWIVTTLVFVLAAAGNLGSYLGTSDKTWTYNFTKLSVSAIILYAYLFLVPIILWIASKYLLATSLNLTRVTCLYGYSMVHFLPAAVLTVIPLVWARWLFMASAYALSARFLLKNIRDEVMEQADSETSKKAFGLLVAMLVMHGSLALTFVLYFYA